LLFDDQKVRAMTVTPPHDVAVLGLGYIGLPTAVALATRGIRVVGVDVDHQRVEAINRGEAPFVEPDLAVAVSGAIAQGFLKAETEVRHANTFILAVPTPIKDQHQADLSYVRAAIEAVAPVLRGGELIVLESTSPPGTTRQVSRWLADLRPDLRFPHDDGHTPDVHVAHCPERVLPGSIMIEIVTNDRVIGGITPRCAERAGELYRTFCHGDIALTDAESAEMSKLAENAYRDVNIAFANEMSLIADELHLDVWNIIAMANRHPRVNILNPGPGVGGHCIAVDPWFIVSATPERARLIRTAREINDGKPQHIIDQVISRARRMIEPKIAALGLAFKANVFDLRDSPAVEIVGRLADELPAVSVLAVEPYARALPQALAARDNVRLTGLAAAVDEADIVLALVEHTQFKSVKHSALEGKVVFDTCGVWR
jgi:UDP-N-acetyl-D-mannosaminuronic acid dehydrogenase